MITMFGKIVIVNNELMKIKGHLNPKTFKKRIFEEMCKWTWTWNGQSLWLCLRTFRRWKEGQERNKEIANT